MISYFELNTFLAEYTERNTDNQYKPVAVGRYGIRTRESIYSKELAKDYSKNKVIFQNTLTVGMGSVQIDIGILTENVKYSVSPAYHTYKITGINPDYLRYCLECRNKDMFERYVKRGSRQGKTIDLGRWLTYEIPVCETQEQKEIVSKLDFVDSLITERREQLAKLDELVKSRFVELFGDPVINPKGWDMPLIEEVVANEKNALKAGPFGSALKKEYYVSSGYKIYGQEQVISGDHTFGNYYIDEERYKSLENCAVQAGDVLISLVGTYGKLLIMPEEFEPGIINPRLMKITFDKKRVNPYYFQHYFQSDSLKKALAENTHGGTMDILNLGIVRKLAMPLPPLELQNEFITFVEQTDKSKLAIQESLEKLETLKKALMQKYFG